MSDRPSDDVASFDLSEHRYYPGFLIRRLNQIAISLFMERLAELDITPLQYTIIRIAARHPRLTQKAVATRAVLDASTTHDIVLRLEAKGLLTRSRDASDRRSLSISLTEAGFAALRASEPVVRAAQQELVACLSPWQRLRFLQMMVTVIEGHLDRQGTNDPPGPWRRNARASAKYEEVFGGGTDPTPAPKRGRARKARPLRKGLSAPRKSRLKGYGVANDTDQ